MNISIVNEKCTGCMACLSACPFNAISWYKNEYGFIYPAVAEDKCRNCEKCVRTCPRCSDQREGLFFNPSKTCLVGINKDEQILYSSSSGGAFSAIADVFCRDGDYLCVALYDDSFNLRHKMIPYNKTSVESARQSKYIQSSMIDAYRDIESVLKTGKRVLFVGTPCQVAGIKKIFGDNPNLLCVDLLCTGVCSPRMLHEHIKYLQEKRKMHIASYSMRRKIQRRSYYDVMGCEITYSDGSKENYYYSYLFKQLFSKHLYLRKSCYTCPFKNPSRVGDITIGDWWGPLEGLIEENKGASVIMINNTDMQQIVEKLALNMSCKMINADRIINQQPALRSEVFSDNSMYPEQVTSEFCVSIMKKTSKKKPLEKVKEIVKYMLPVKAIQYYRNRRDKI